MKNTLDREWRAMTIHQGTTQIPGNSPHECDYETADLILQEVEKKYYEPTVELPVTPCEIWDILIEKEPRKTGFGVFPTWQHASDFLAKLNEDMPGLARGCIIRGVERP